ncbi:MAG TPA: TldD/PmbA family protein [Solirubrobacterales bacterium]|nr:TldD/PmbA family protein [Solirubrobacterales bacterium]
MSALAEQATGAVEQAVAAGAGDAEAYASEAENREVRVHGGEVESLAAATQRGLGLRVWIDGRVGYGFGTDLSSRGVETIAARAVEAARVADEDEFAGPPDAEGERPAVAGLSDPSRGEWPPAQIADLALAVEQTALESDSRIAAVEQAVYFDSAERVAIVSSSAVGGEYEATSCYAYLQALAEGENGRETGLGFDLARSPAGLDPVAIGREGAERATEMIGSIKPASRSCPVVLDPTVAASFVGLLGKAVGADAVQRGRSPLAERLGEEVAAEAFVLHDDGLDPDGFAAAPIDAEGTPRRRTTLIEAGRLRTFLHDSYTARRGAAVSTGNAGRSGYRSPPGVAASNLIVSPGAASLEQLLREAGDGVYINDVAGLHSGVNPVTGVFSVGASGRAIRGGERAEPLREFTIASDLVSMLRAVRAAGSEPRWVPFGGSVSAPPLLIGEMTVSGS